jgi:NAD(P)-dependent dehydrogenase (short-subunit alcohol dehydrogenase family)
MRKVALITGSARRIGSELSRHLAGKRWDLVLHYNSSFEQVQDLEEELKLAFPEGDYRIMQADLNNSAETENLIPNVISAFGRLDLLINNASVFEPGGVEDTSTEQFDKHININLRAPFILTQNYITHSEEGVIVNITDTRITKNSNDYTAYNLSKKALWEFTKIAALEAAPKVRVNALAPGLVLPPAGKSKKYFNNLAANTPLQKPAGLVPLIKSIDYIIENENLTGQILFCNSGEQLL